MRELLEAADLRHRLAPTGSLRERIARVLIGPLWRRARAWRLAAGGAQVRVLTWEGAAQRMRTLPDKPQILLLKLDHIGDFVLCLGAFEALRQGFPRAEITLTCGGWARPWAEACGLFDRVVSFDFFPPRIEDWHGPTAATFAAWDALALGRFDLAVDLRHDADTRPLLARTQATFRAGYRAPPGQGGEALDLALPDAEAVSLQAGTGVPLHAGQRASALAALVVASFARRNEALARRLCTGRLPAELAAPYATLAPGAGTRIREWPTDRMGAIAAMLVRDHGLKIAVVGSAGDADHAAPIAAAAGAENVVNLAGVLPLTGLPDVLAGARLHVGNDTGSTHLAAALGTPTVAVISGLPTLEVWHPVGAAVRVVAGRARCSPCHILRAEQCRFGIACLKAVQVADVEAVCHDLLGAAVSEGKNR